MVLSETQLDEGAGLTLLRVQRGCLRLDECLGVTEGRANDFVETVPHTLVPDSRATDEDDVMPHRLVSPGA
jgi:hypothetical protein